MELTIKYQFYTRSSRITSGDGTVYVILWPWLGSDFTCNVWSTHHPVPWTVLEATHNLDIQAEFTHD
jgi:hypothetical protein